MQLITIIAKYLTMMRGRSLNLKNTALMLGAALIFCLFGFNKVIAQNTMVFNHQVGGSISRSSLTFSYAPFLGFKNEKRYSPLVFNTFVALNIKINNESLGRNVIETAYLPNLSIRYYIKRPTESMNLLSGLYIINSNIYAPSGWYVYEERILTNYLGLGINQRIAKRFNFEMNFLMNFASYFDRPLFTFNITPDNFTNFSLNHVLFKK